MAATGNRWLKQFDNKSRPACSGASSCASRPASSSGALRILSRIAGVTPLRVSYVIAVLVGDFIYYTWREHSGNAVSNMRRVLGPAGTEREARRVARASFRNYAKTLADFIRFPHVTTEEIERRIVDPYGLDVMDAALARGKGVLALSGHIGNWDFAGAVMGARDTPMYALADSFEPPELDALVVETRLRNGVRIIKMEPTAMRTIFEALRRNEVVLMLIDQAHAGRRRAGAFLRRDRLAAQRARRDRAQDRRDGGGRLLHPQAGRPAVHRGHRAAAELPEVDQWQ